jgi:hypothetical protein
MKLGIITEEECNEIEQKITKNRNEQIEANEKRQLEYLKQKYEKEK